MLKTAGVNKFSLRQTINQITFDFNAGADTSPESDAEDVTWSEVVRKCIDQRRERIWTNVKDITVTDSEASSRSLQEHENLFSEEPSEEDAKGLQAVIGCSERDEGSLQDVPEVEGQEEEVDEDEYREEEEEEENDEEELSGEDETLTTENVDNGPESEVEHQDEDDAVAKDDVNRQDHQVKHGLVSEAQACGEADGEQNDTHKEDCAEVVRDEACVMSYNLIVEPQIFEPLEKSPAKSEKRNVSSKNVFTTLIERVPDTPGVLNPRRSSQGKRNSSRKISITPEKKISSRRSSRIGLNSSKEIPEKTLSPATPDSLIPPSSTKSKKSLNKTASSAATIKSLHYNSFDSEMSVPDTPFLSPTPSEKSCKNDTPFMSHKANDSMELKRASQKVSEEFAEVNRQLLFSSETGEPEGNIEADHEEDHEEELEGKRASSSVEEKALGKKSRKKNLEPPPTSASSISGRPQRFLAGRRLEKWRNERPIYEVQENEKGVPVFVCKGITKASSPDILKRKLPLKGNNQKRQKENPDESKAELCELSTSFVQKSHLTRTKYQDIVKPYEDVVWKATKGSESVLLGIAHRDKENGSAIGFLKLLGPNEKPPCTTGFYETYYTVFKGVVAITLGDEPSIILKKFESIIVPPRTLYTVKNLCNGESLLHFNLNKTQDA